MKNKIYKDIEYYTEECCEECGEIVHAHFECPVCNEWQGFDFNDELSNRTVMYEDFKENDVICCEKCEHLFRIIDRAYDFQLELL